MGFIVGLMMLIGASAVQEPVFLGSAANYVVLAKAGISTTGTTYIVGDIGVSPIAATGMTGFGLVLNNTTPSSTSDLVSGNIYAADYGIPTPSDLTEAVLAMEAAYTEAANRSFPDELNLLDGLIGGATLDPGLYRWGSTVDIASDLIFSGNSTDVWVLQVGGTLDLGTGVKVILVGGCVPSNIFWQVQGQATFEVGVVFQGILLGKTGIAMKSGASVTGRALAQTAVTLIANSIRFSGTHTTRPPTNAPPTAPPTDATASPTNASPTLYEPPYEPAENASISLITASPTTTKQPTSVSTTSPTTQQPTKQPTSVSTTSPTQQPTPFKVFAASLFDNSASCAGSGFVILGVICCFVLN